MKNNRRIGCVPSTVEKGKRQQLELKTSLYERRHDYRERLVVTLIYEVWRMNTNTSIPYFVDIKSIKGQITQTNQRVEFTGMYTVRLLS